MTRGAQKRRKHSRTRTGCLTCRQRRIKCDEKRPTCAHCDRGPRECNYSPHMEPKEETTENSSTSTNSELVRYSSSSVTSSPSTESNDPFNSLQSRHTPLSIRKSMPGIPQLISPHGIRSKPVQFFLQYHQETITEAHYLRLYDYSKLSTVIIFTLAEASDALQHAMIAFSALIYSIKVNRGARQIAFLYYSVALRQLRLLLDKPTMDMTDCFAAVATALQLSLFDRFFGDNAKCFRHLKGAARILQHITNPVQVCSSIIGRSLLEWFIQFENYCCIIAPYKILLPRAWREEDIRMRHKLAVVEYPRLSDSERKARILDDVWLESWLIVPELADVVYNVAKLKNLAVGARTARAIELRTKLTQIEETFDQFSNLPYVLEVLEPATSSSSHSSKHIHCCPPPPFIPYTLQFPPAGILRIMLFSLRCYMQSFLWPPIYAACGSETELPKPDETYAIEICRTFAGIEDALDDNPDSCLPFFTLLVSVISTCPQELRLWLWHKLVHFEQQGLATFKNPVKENYAKLWNITDIRSEVKGISESTSAQNEPEDIAEI